MKKKTEIKVYNIGIPYWLQEIITKGRFSKKFKIPKHSIVIRQGENQKIKKHLN